MKKDKMTLNEWIINGHVGASSKTMWAVLVGVDIERGDKPYDPDDFSRCYKLYKQCELLKGDLYKISKKLPYWEPYINNWDKLCNMYEANLENNWTTSKDIGMYEFMHKLREESNEIRNCNK